VLTQLIDVNYWTIISVEGNRRGVFFSRHKLNRITHPQSHDEAVVFGLRYPIISLHKTLIVDRPFCVLCKFLRKKSIRLAMQWVVVPISIAEMNFNSGDSTSFRFDDLTGDDDFSIIDHVVRYTRSSVALQ
jgi:hypothetical protein